jgi:hypothetical protein
MAAAQLDAGELDGVIDDRSRIGTLTLRFAAFHEGTDAMDDLPGAFGLACCLQQRGDQVVLDD